MRALLCYLAFTAVAAGLVVARDALAESPCASAVAQTDVSYEEVPRGAALTFVTAGDVAEVRRRVKARATEVEVCPCCKDHPCTVEAVCPRCQRFEAKKLPAHRSRTEEISGGMRLVVTAERAGDVTELRKKLQAQVRKMQLQAGTCQ